jgi:hypothetical protein
MSQERNTHPDETLLVSPESSGGNLESAPEQPVAQIVAEVQAEAGAQSYSFLP